MFINTTTFYIDLALAFVGGVGALWCFIIVYYGLCGDDGDDDTHGPDGFQG